MSQDITGATRLTRFLQAVRPRRRVPLLVVGRSHTRALALAAEAEGARDVATIIMTNNPNEQRAWLNPLELSAYAPGLVVSMVAGNHHNRLGLFEPEEPFDFLFDENDSVIPGRRLVRRAEIAAAMLAEIKPATAIMEKLRAAYDVPMVHVTAPPPVATGALDQRIMNRAARSGRDLRLSPPSLRMKLYRLQKEILAKECAALDCTILPVPEGTLDENGFLAAPFQKGDATHANPRYGALVLGQLRAYAADGKANP
ncbi:MAG: hypothetical protein AAGF45_08105 [Pseudomonadota bacterium]